MGEMIELSLVRCAETEDKRSEMVSMHSIVRCSTSD